jgi:hypothetical protein
VGAFAKSFSSAGAQRESAGGRFDAPVADRLCDRLQPASPSLGHLFQNRYKSILCQQEPYLLELVRYIHLNPLRAKIVEGLEALNDYRYCGHSVLMGRQKAGWQDSDSVLNRFGRRRNSARRGYREFLSKGIDLGRRPELTGGGLIRSLGGWDEVKAQRRQRASMKGDERILGDSEYVAEVLRAADEALQRKYQLKAQGLDVDKVAERVAGLSGRQLATG